MPIHIFFNILENKLRCNIRCLDWNQQFIFKRFCRYKTPSKYTFDVHLLLIHTMYYISLFYAVMSFIALQHIFPNRHSMKQLHVFMSFWRKNWCTIRFMKTLMKFWWKFWWNLDENFDEFLVITFLFPFYHKTCEKLDWWKLS